VRRRKLIMIAEDEADAANLLALHLQRHGYRTLSVPDGREALNAVFEHKPDLLILDLMLPYLHGFELCRLLKAAPATRHLPIIMVTARTCTEDKLKGFSLGANDYVTKPFEIRELLARVQALLRATENPRLDFSRADISSRFDR
jgi:DNA-binding response OmpR family regulator